jgi:hypothetical protein
LPPLDAGVGLERFELLRHTSGGLVACGEGFGRGNRLPRAWTLGWGRGGVGTGRRGILAPFAGEGAEKNNDRPADKLLAS